MSETGRMIQLSGLITEGEAPSHEFKKAMDEYLKMLTHYHDMYYHKEYPNQSPPTFTAEYGQVRVKVVRQETYSHGRSVHCFVDFNGDILKAAGWSAPAKGKRGSIYDKNPPLDSGSFYR